VPDTVWIRGDRLHQARVARGLRLIDVAAGGTSPASLSRIERNARHRVSMTLLTHLVGRLGLCIDGGIDPARWGGVVVHRGWTLMMQSRVADALLAARLWDVVIHCPGPRLSLEAELLRAWAEANNGINVPPAVLRQLAERAVHAATPGVALRAGLFEGALLARLGRSHDALALLDRVRGEARRAGDRDATAAAGVEMGRIWLRLGDLERGLEVTSDVPANASPFPTAQLAAVRGVTLERLGRLDEAEKALHDAAGAADGVPNAVLKAKVYAALGRLHASRGDWARADAAVLLAIALYVHTGLSARAIGMLEAALRRFTRAGLVPPSHVPAGGHPAAARGTPGPLVLHVREYDARGDPSDFEAVAVAPPRIVAEAEHPFPAGSLTVSSRHPIRARLGSAPPAESTSAPSSDAAPAAGGRQIATRHR
jgi:tetratricopeptide (TPR) repeat protein